MFKVKKGFAPDISKEIFEIDNRNNCFQHDVLINDIMFEYEIASFVSPKIWGTLPNDWKHETSLESFKENLKRWGS